MPQTNAKSNRACMEPCRRLLAALPPASGFEPHTFATFAYTPKFLHGRGPRVQVRRSFRFELEGCCSHLSIEGPARAAERRRIVANLLAAGYEPWLDSNDQADLRRWLRGARERRAELELLHALGFVGAPARWPQRVQRSRPQPVRLRKWPRDRWINVMAEVEARSMRWDECCLGLVRGDSLAARTPSGTAHVGVGVLALAPRTFYAYGSIADDGDRGGTTWLPPALATRVRGILRAAGYTVTPARSVKPGKVVAGRLYFSQNVRDARQASALSIRIYDALGRALGE